MHRILVVFVIFGAYGCSQSRYTLVSPSGERGEFRDPQSVTQNAAIATKLFPQIVPALDSPLEVLEAPLPSYPAVLRTSGVKGSVSVKFHIARDGFVDVAEVEEPAPANLGDLCLDAIRRWRFKQLTRNGQPVEIWARYTFLFKLPD